MKSQGQMILLAAASITFAPAVVIAWALTFHTGCLPLILPLTIAVVLATALTEQSVARRRCRAQCWFEQGSCLYRVLHRWVIAAVLSSVAASAGTVVLAAGVALADFLHVAVLAADAVLVALLYVVFAHLAGARLRVTPAYRRIFAIRVTVMLNMLAMLITFVYLGLESPPPAYLDGHLELKPTLDAAVRSVTAECLYVDRVLSWVREGEAFGWWLMLRAHRQIEVGELRWLAWVLFLSGGTLGLWAYSTFCARVVAKGTRWMLGR